MRPSERYALLNRVRRVLTEMKGEAEDQNTFRAGRVAEACERAEDAAFDVLNMSHHFAGDHRAGAAVDAFSMGRDGDNGDLSLRVAILDGDGNVLAEGPRAVPADVWRNDERTVEMGMAVRAALAEVHEARLARDQQQREQAEEPSGERVEPQFTTRDDGS